MENYRHWFLKTAISYLGTPYIWGGDDPSGFDCSGYVLECLKSIGAIREQDDFTAHRLLQYLEHDFTHQIFSVKVIDRPEASALLFYLNAEGIARHVTVCLDEHFQIGAIGGTSKTVNSSLASIHNAFIKIRPIESLNNRVIVLLTAR